MSQRTDRCDDLLRAELSELLRREMRDPRVALVTVTSVEVSGDLRHASVTVSALGDEAARTATVRALDHARGLPAPRAGPSARPAGDARAPLRSSTAAPNTASGSPICSSRCTSPSPAMTAPARMSDDPVRAAATACAGQPVPADQPPESRRRRHRLRARPRPASWRPGQERRRSGTSTRPRPLYRALPGAERIHVGAERPADFPAEFDAAIVLECPGLDRTGLERALPALPLLNIDHHLGNQLYGHVNWVDTAESPAVGEMVFQLAVDLGVRIDADTATLPLSGRWSPTPADSASPTRRRGLRGRRARWSAAGARVGAGLAVALREPARAGAAPARRPARHPRGPTGTTGAIATVQLTRAMFERRGRRPGDSEGLIDRAALVAGVDAVAMLRELEAGDWKVSLRSRGAIDVEAVARNRGGGGHRNAAGCRATGDLRHDRGRAGGGAGRRRSGRAHER